jgi:ABC-type transporter Mla maintaining outer membrane lipid asymmetry permease subunit MlaE
VVPAGFALGTVMTLHTRSTLITFGAGAMIPTVQALAFFVEIGPLVAGLLLAGRVRSGIGAVLANMRVTEQIDAIESLLIDSFKFLAVPRVLACVVALPLLTLSWISRACSAATWQSTRLQELPLLFTLARLSHLRAVEAGKAFIFSRGMS